MKFERSRSPKKHRTLISNMLINGTQISTEIKKKVVRVEKQQNEDLSMIQMYQTQLDTEIETKVQSMHSSDYH